MAGGRSLRLRVGRVLSSRARAREARCTPAPSAMSPAIGPGPLRETTTRPGRSSVAAREDAYTTARAIEHGLRLVAEGADILDIGGESTRPGSDPVPLAEELRRVIPVIEGLSAKSVWEGS